MPANTGTSETLADYRTFTKGIIEPGCEIIVPTKGPKDNSTLTQWLRIGTSMASLATMFVSIANLIKK
jgi:hypothetical protein